MKKIVFSVLFVSSLGFAQIEKKVDDFTKVTSFDKIDVLLVPGDENKVVLNGSESEKVELVTKNGELKIRLPFTKLLKGDAISATVYYKKVDAIEANEGSRIASEATFQSTSFDVIAKEGSEIKLNINVAKVTVKILSGSSVSLEGTSANQDVLVNSGGIYDAPKLVTHQTLITSNAGGKATIFATDLVDAKVRAGGTIWIHGKPKQINQKIIAGGKIEQVN